MDTVIARTRPSHFTLSKKIVSPTPTARTTEIASSHKARADMSVSPPSPSIAAIHATIKTLPTVERRALSATELNGGERLRTRRLITDQVRAEPVAQSAPTAASERKGKRRRLSLRAPSGRRRSRGSGRRGHGSSPCTRATYVGAPVGSSTVNRRSPRSRRSGPMMRQRASRTTAPPSGPSKRVTSITTWYWMARDPDHGKSAVRAAGIRAARLSAMVLGTPSARPQERASGVALAERPRLTPGPFALADRRPREKLYQH